MSGPHPSHSGGGGGGVWDNRENEPPFSSENINNAQTVVACRECATTQTGLDAARLYDIKEMLTSRERDLQAAAVKQHGADCELRAAQCLLQQREAKLSQQLDRTAATAAALEARQRAHDAAVAANRVALDERRAALNSERELSRVAIDEQRAAATAFVDGERAAAAKERAAAAATKAAAAAATAKQRESVQNDVASERMSLRAQLAAAGQQLNVRSATVANVTLPFRVAPHT
jgi:hypothetical protein